ncbi:DDE transposase [Sphingomonas antarctica]|uniref:IS1595 family transposase n=1 Tax=Sphingomonas antarctica TaxID=2040274 RepID=UPI0039E81AF0
MTNLTAPQFTNVDAAREHLEALRWPDGAYCPHCGAFAVKRLPEQRGRATKAHPDGAVRKGIYQCNACRQQFSVTVGTVFERSKVPLHKWLLATRLLCSSKKGYSAHQMHRDLGVTYKTAWFMEHRIRAAMAPSGDLPPMGGEGTMVEVDETYIGRIKGVDGRIGGGVWHKMKVLSLIDRATGEARSHVVPNTRVVTIAPIVQANLAPKAKLMTDEASVYRYFGWKFARHMTVNHSASEYVKRGDSSIHTNTIEGFFSIFKRGMRGIYQHCGEQHLQRYLAEFDFRYSNRAALGINDEARAATLLSQIGGKRLTYRRINGLAA